MKVTLFIFLYLFLVPTFEGQDNVIWAEEFHLGIEFVMQRIELCSDLSELKDVHIKDEITALAWLNKFYPILLQDQHCLDLVQKGTYEIIPNQNGQFCKKSALSLDIDIEETLKDVLQILGNDWKNFLLHAEVVALDKSEFLIKNQEMIIEAINRELNNERNAHGRSAINLLLSCFSNDSNFPAKRKQMYKFCVDLFGDEMPAARIIKNWDSSIWKTADDMRVGRIIETVATFGNISPLSTSVETEGTETGLAWIKDLIEFLIQHNYSSYLDKAILPDQNGDFKTKDELWLDNGEIDETLKDIALTLGYDCRAEMLDKAIYLELPTSREKTSGMIASEITRRITPILAEVPRTENTRKIAKSLFSWFYNNPDEARQIFPELYPNKHRLYDDEQIAKNMIKAEQLDALLEERNMTLDELKKLLNKKNLKEFLEKEEGESPKAVIPIQDALIQLGITTMEDLQKALLDQAISRRFSHISTASLEMLQVVHQLIERAKQNVRDFLSLQPDYDCTGWNEVGKTVIQGVNKKGRPINLVIRPSDGGQVIFYYSQEKDTLESQEAELWVENQYSIPQHLTLGKILKRNGINRIEV